MNAICHLIFVISSRSQSRCRDESVPRNLLFRYFFAAASFPGSSGVLTDEIDPRLTSIRRLSGGTRN